VILSYVLPYVIAAVVIALILQKYPLASIRREMAQGNSLPLFPIAFVTYIVSLVFVAAADRRVLHGLLQGSPDTPSYFAVAKGKAASVLLHIVHYSLGQGAYATWMSRRTALGVGRAGGLIFYIIAAELSSISLFAAIVILVFRPDVPRAILPTVLVITTVLTGFLLVAPSTRLERYALFETWARVGRRTGIVQLLIRLCQHASTASGTWLAASAFGLEIPFSVMLSYLPVILVVASLPVNVAGFGAVQGAWLLLEPWASGERILAFSVVWQTLSAVAIVIRGLPFLRGVLADIRRGKREPGQDSLTEA